MTKNPIVGQKIFFLIEDEIHESSIKYIDDIRIVTNPDCFILRIDEIFPTEKLAYEKSLKTLNKEIFKLSKQREKLATKLAKLLEKG